MKSINDIKISTKLILIGMFFIVPMATLFYMSILPLLTSIKARENRIELIQVIRPVTLLFELLPQHLRIRSELEDGDIKEVELKIEEQLAILDAKGFHSFSADWVEIKTQNMNNWRTLLRMYVEYMNTSITTLKQLEEDDVLLSVNDLASYYFADLSLDKIPNLAIRVVNIGNIVRAAVFRSRSEGKNANQEAIKFLLENRLKELGDNLNLLRNAEHREVREAFLNGVANLQLNDSHRKNATIQLNSQLEIYTIAFQKFTDDMDEFIRKEKKITDINEIVKNTSQVYIAIGNLWNSTLDEIEFLLNVMLDEDRKEIYVRIAITTAVVLLAILVVLFTSYSIHKSSKNLQTVFSSLSNHDLSVTVDAQSRDEFGELTIAFNDFLADLREIFETFKKNANLVTDAVYDLSASAREISATANEQSAGVQEIVATMEGNKNLSEQVALKTTEVADIAGDMQNLIAKGAALRDANQRLVQEIRDQNNKIIDEIKNVDVMISRIAESTKDIDHIAEQTKLIAFNASLEAAGSGESGARFGVVAKEIRKFSDNVAESTKEIKAQIYEAKKAAQVLIGEANNGSRRIEHGYERMNEQKAVFEEIVSNAQNVAARNMQISNLSKQQEYASSQIFETLKEIGTGVRQFVIATNSSSKIADSLNEMSEKLKNAIERYKTRAE
ncbi:MAG: methyl-accepting chemotaxis protein [Helicobacteraceae bacterium]|jgi:methyl-accepting chemotaxis protein|nr:methyl-accepting chemotaxis protein [Helicobacteraceae bacterium]